MGSEKSFREQPDLFSLRSIAKDPSVSLNVAIDHLRKCEVIHSPTRKEMMFRWPTTIETMEQARNPGIDEYILFLCKERTAKEFIASSSARTSSALVVLTESSGVPEWLTQSAWMNRSIVVRQNQSLSYYSALITNLFLAVRIWESEMDRIVYAEGLQKDRGALPSLIEASTAFLGGFLSVTDTGFNLIGCSKGITPPGEVYSHLVSEGCYDREEIEGIEHDVLSKAGTKNPIIVRLPTETNPFTTLHAPLFIDGSYLFHFTFVMPSDRSVTAMTDMFAKFVSRAKTVSLEFWKHRIELESPCHKALIGLISGRKMTHKYLNTQLSQTDIPSTSHFRLLCYKIDPNMTFLQNSTMSKCIGTLNEGHCYPFAFDDSLLVLCCSPTNNESGVSLKKLLVSTSNIMFEPFGMVAFTSQTFSDIKDIGLAYRQVKIAGKMKRMLQTVYPHGYDGEGAFPYVPFDHILPFYVLDRTADPDLLSFSFRNSVVDAIYDEGAEEEIQLIDILWEYLCSNLNATETANRLYLHRNTVLYHIHKLESRFDLNLSSPLVRNRLLLDYLHYFSHTIR